MPTHAEPMVIKEKLQLTYVVDKDDRSYSLNAVDIDCSNEAFPSVSDPVELFTWPVDDSFPFGYSWSPDGKSLAYSALGFSDKTNIYTIDESGENKKSVTRSAIDEVYPTWSPGDDRIVYTISTYWGSHLGWSNLDGSAGGDFLSGELVYSVWDPRDPKWSQDGETLIFSAYRSIEEHIDQVFISNRNGTTIRQLTESTDASYTPSFSPDGSWLVFVRDVINPDSYGGGEDEAIFLMRSDGTDDRKLIGVQGKRYYSPSWSPRCDLIAFVHPNQLGKTDIYIISPDGTTVTNITNSSYINEWSPEWRVVIKP